MYAYEKLKGRVKGVVVVMVTPFKDDYEIDKKALKDLTRFLIDSGIKEGNGVLVPAGSTGECPMLTDEERREIFSIVKEEAGNKVPILGGCNHTDTRTVIKLVKYAEEAGLDGVMISPPYYWKPFEEIILNHYRNIIKNTDMGIMIYNNWFASQLDITVETMIKLVNEIPNIVALKDNTPYIAKAAEMVQAVGDKIAVIDGAGEPHEPYSALMGAKGFVTGEACVIPKTCIKIYEAEEKKDYETAKNILKKAAPLLDFLLKGEQPTDYLVRIKACMNIIGIKGGIPRLPLIPADKNIIKKAKTIIDSYELKENWNKK